jgi:hypothetical protein
MSTEIDSVLETEGMTAPTTFTVETNENYNLEYFIAPYGTRGYKMINTINVKDKSNKLLAICNFPTSPPFWKDYVTRIALDFSFNNSEPIRSTLRVTLKTPILVERDDAVAFSKKPRKSEAPGFDELVDTHIVDRVEENADNITVLTFKVDPKNFEDREQLKRRQAFRYGGGKSKNKKSNKKSYKKSKKNKSKKKNKRRGF